MSATHECIVHKDQLICNCQSFKYNSLCKHSLCIAQSVDILKKHVDYVAVRLGTSMKSRTGLVVPVKSAAGRKGEAQESESNNSASGLAKPFTKTHHNN